MQYFTKYTNFKQNYKNFTDRTLYGSLCEIFQFLLAKLVIGSIIVSSATPYEVLPLKDLFIHQKVEFDFTLSEIKTNLGLLGFQFNNLTPLCQ